MARAIITTHVETGALEAKLALFTESGARRALRSATSRAGVRGRNLVRQKTPVKTGVSRAGIRSVSRSAGATAIARIYPSGPHAYITRWQDQGTGPRHKKNGQYTGMVEPQYMFERGAAELDGEVEAIYNAVFDAALARAGLL